MRPEHAGAICENVTSGLFFLDQGSASVVNDTIATAAECCGACREDVQCVRFMLVPGESGAPTKCYLWYFLGGSIIPGSPSITIGYGEAGFLTCVRARVRGGWGAAPSRTP